MIENIDENMGRLMDKLHEWNLFEDTILIFMSDNGMTGGGSGRMGQPVAKGFPFFNAGMKGLKGSADEGGVRVPFLVRWDGQWKAGRNIDTVSAHIDVLPTFAAIAGIKTLPKNQVEGRSFLPLLAGEKKTLPDNRYLFTHKGRWKTGTEPNEFQWKNFAVRNQRYRFVGGGTAVSVSERQRKEGISPKDALFDMVKDPAQTTNIIEQKPEVAAKMRAAYAKFWKEARPLMVNEDVPMSPTRPYHVWYEKQMKAGGIPQWKEPEL